MLLHREPSEEVIRKFIASQRDLPFSYAQVGATQNEFPTGCRLGYKVDHNRIQLGSGKDTYARAVSALREWKQFDLGWVKVAPARQPLEVGTTVAVQAEVFGLWWVNAARIVYMVDEQQANTVRFGFAYGTLPNHVERGEERFMVEWQKGDDSVWYDLYAFSRPKHPLTRIGFPLTRALQAQFVRDSLTVMKAAVKELGPE
ncbi:MAG TPA: DUF1990 domain-containing protein [Pyrinomonadaceae bacterium]|jgi:uncharacterized protein (UPF0548 family)|nr:DUF1990 domain-containing protein [Pyrinomonadaceae bacterium]